MANELGIRIKHQDSRGTVKYVKAQHCFTRIHFHWLFGYIDKVCGSFELKSDTSEF